MITCERLTRKRFNSSSRQEPINIQATWSICCFPWLQVDRVHLRRLTFFEKLNIPDLKIRIESLEVWEVQVFYIKVITASKLRFWQFVATTIVLYFFYKMGCLILNHFLPLSWQLFCKWDDSDMTGRYKVYCPERVRYVWKALQGTSAAGQNWQLPTLN